MMEGGHMMRRMTATCLVTLALAGCNAVDAPERASPAPIDTVPEDVRAIAAPYQDLSTARLREADGCYWYRHAGPVETTLLPLRTTEGRPICARARGPGAARPAAAMGRGAVSRPR